MRAIGVSHTACKDEFDEMFDLTAGGYFNLYNNSSINSIRGQPLDRRVANHSMISPSNVSLKTCWVRIKPLKRCSCQQGDLCVK